ncbi:hypothetical protein MVEN_00688800 [Mycena venus]|uniref:GATA-type domain-containing protein n=1 Tax=Mycena venus TaxID=2733690 RepID=A0A8H6YJC4_9AGAR|nr:hypothetical protein MVEN_00688800 [Mycena venus]
MSSTRYIAHASIATPSTEGWPWNYESSPLLLSQRRTEIRRNSTAPPHSDDYLASLYPRQSPQITRNAAAVHNATQTYVETPSLPTQSPLSFESFNSNSWNETLFMFVPNANGTGYASPVPSLYTLPPSPHSQFEYLLPCPSPSPYPSSSGAGSPVSWAYGASRCTSSDTSSSSGPEKACSHCAATSTPLWRRDPTTYRTLCNACGLYLQQRNKMRPAALIAADQPDDDDDEHVVVPGAPECSHCHTHRTSVWRRSKDGARVCNACGVYARLRGRDRPLSLSRKRIRPRCKHPKQEKS